MHYSTGSADSTAPSPRQTHTHDSGTAAPCPASPPVHRYTTAARPTHHSRSWQRYCHSHPELQQCRWARIVFAIWRGFSCFCKKFSCKPFRTAWISVSETRKWRKFSDIGKAAHSSKSNGIFMMFILGSTYYCYVKYASENMNQFIGYLCIEHG